MYVGLFGHSAVVFHVFMFFSIFMFFMFYSLFVWLCFLSDILLIYSAVQLPVCLINLLTLLYFILRTPISTAVDTCVRMRALVRMGAQYNRQVIIGRLIVLLYELTLLHALHTETFENTQQIFCYGTATLPPSKFARA